ncbi:MAG: spore coat protein, partial [Proteobacteria bacterium]|nr:spore coat protein [Pseudomonadota bacterium]
MTKKIRKDLFVLEMANNHMGEVSHGVRLIEEFGKVCQQFPEFNFAFKLQYRDLDTFIHPSMQGREDIKFIKRFEETRLSIDEFDELVQVSRDNNFLVMSTPFDEKSVKVINDQNLDYLKIASCSFGDWPLLERAVEEDLPIIASTAGADLEVIDRVISFFQHRKKECAIMHCVGEYPTQQGNLHLGQIDLLKARYPDVPIGFSTHESPDQTIPVQMAIAKGAKIFEKHIGVETNSIKLNDYSANPSQARKWVKSAKVALNICGSSYRLAPKKEEIESLCSLKRGVFAKG